MQTYYKLSDAVKYADKLSYVATQFKNSTVTFVVFKDFDDFLSKKSHMLHLHEAIILSTESTQCLYAMRQDGRLCFDFDMKLGPVQIDIAKWISDIESQIILTAQTLYKNFDPNAIEFIWSTSDTTSKISKHLTVKGIYYEKWIPMAKQFYLCFNNSWNSVIDYCKADYFVDSFIVRPNANLRFVGSYKPNSTSMLSFDNALNDITDSLIRPPHLWSDNVEQSVSFSDLLLALPIYTHGVASGVTNSVSNGALHNLSNSLSHNVANSVSNSVTKYILPKIICKTDDKQLADARKLTQMLSASRASIFSTWYVVGICLHNIDDRLLTDWIDFSKKTLNGNFAYGVCENKWIRMSPNNYTIASLHYFAKEDNPGAYAAMIADNGDEIDKVARNNGHNVVCNSDCVNYLTTHQLQAIIPDCDKKISILI